MPTPASTPVDKSTAVPGWQPDLDLLRQFPDADGTVRSCDIWMGAVADPATGTGDVSERLADASTFLREGDWTSVGVRLEDMPADQLAARRGQGMGDAELLMMVLSDRIMDEYRAAGFLGDGVSVQTFNRCFEN